jgi:DNA-binding protein VF530
MAAASSKTFPTTDCLQNGMQTELQNCKACRPITPSPVQNHPMPPAPQARNPLHGLTLEHIVTALHSCYGWDGLAERIPLRCFQLEPSISSSLKLLRKTPWAREKVESLYLFMLRQARRDEG